ncbi:magnesium transporter CorA family protein [Domibacillus robiginosus]|uniref:magnesium transporter CorA family protein n=1 Tax=Domibacillus robiginosus TaxID=1071054 RepID=UPI000A573A49|nr:magnesium transporter CorA family protein [Domibacillus robiginosus]
MEHTFHSSQWKWFELDIKDTQLIQEATKNSHQCKSWAKKVEKNDNNFINMYTGTPGEENLWGSLIYQQDVEKRDKNSTFHFFLTREKLITIDLDLSKLNLRNAKTMKEKMHHCKSPIEGFLVLLSEITADFLNKIDEFEVKLYTLLWDIKENNRTTILDRAAAVDHELLVWKNLVIPIKETKMAAEEAFGSQTAQGEQFQRAKCRIERVETLLDAYESEIKSVLNLENLISTHRGNEITKTLTIMTTLFAPTTALGAIWGMNFKHMPELEWKMGYAFAGVLIVISTVFLYFYLKSKGWMGDILNTKRKKSFFR